MARLDDAVARRLLVSSAESHEDVMRAVRLAAADESERLAVLKRAVDDGLRTRRHLDYWGSSSWARDAAPVVDALAEEVTTAPSAELVVLFQRAAGHLVKVILRADDSDGMIGDLSRDVLDLHRQACAAGVPIRRRWRSGWSGSRSTTRTSSRSIRSPMPTRSGTRVSPCTGARSPSAPSLPTQRSIGPRRCATSTEAFRASPPSMPLNAWRSSTATSIGSSSCSVVTCHLPTSFTRVAEAMVELGDPDDALRWARRGIAETSGWQVAKLYDLAADLVADANDLDEVVELRRHHHERMPSASTYATLQVAASAVDTWAVEVDQARAVLAERDPAGYIDALLADDEADEAWAVAANGDREILASQWLRLAEAREPTVPGDAMVVYLRLADDVLVRADKRAYRDAVRHLNAARRAATAADRTDELTEHLEVLRERNRRRPSFMAMLDKAGLG